MENFRCLWLCASLDGAVGQTRFRQLVRSEDWNATDLRIFQNWSDNAFIMHRVRSSADNPERLRTVKKYNRRLQAQSKLLLRGRPCRSMYYSMQYSAAWMTERGLLCAVKDSTCFKTEVIVSASALISFHGLGLHSRPSDGQRWRRNVQNQKNYFPECRNFWSWIVGNVCDETYVACTLTCTLIFIQYAVW